MSKHILWVMKRAGHPSRSNANSHKCWLSPKQVLPLIPSLLSSHLIRVPVCRCSHCWRVTHTLKLATEPIREYLLVVSMLIVIGQLVVVSAFAFSISLCKTHTCLAHAGAGFRKVTHWTTRPYLEWYIFNTATSQGRNEASRGGTYSKTHSW